MRRPRVKRLASSSPSSSAASSTARNCGMSLGPNPSPGTPGSPTGAGWATPRTTASPAIRSNRAGPALFRLPGLVRIHGTDVDRNVIGDIDHAADATHLRDRVIGCGPADAVDVLVHLLDRETGILQVLRDVGDRAVRRRRHDPVFLCRHVVPRSPYISSRAHKSDPAGDGLPPGNRSNLART